MFTGCFRVPSWHHKPFQSSPTKSVSHRKFKAYGHFIVRSIPELSIDTLTDPNAVGGLLRAIEGFTGAFTTRCALRLAAFTFVRPGELRHAEWTEFDLDKTEWRIPAGKMKLRERLIVPLSTQAVAVLRQIQPLTGTVRYVFPSERNKVWAAYNFAEYLPGRRKMMQQWADYLDKLRTGAVVIPLHGESA